MLRFLLAGLLLSGAVLDATAPAWAFDYEEPFVPPQFLLGSPAPEAPTRDATPRLLVLRSGNAPFTAEDPTAAAGGEAAARSLVSSCRASSGEGISGRALWNWNAC